MSTKYADHGAYPAYTATPTWGVPRDGDGAAIGASGASATTLLSMAGATAVAGNTISIMGATLTCVASGAGVNQFNAGSGATLVANLVAAINRTNNTSTVAPQADNWDRPKLQDAVFAKQGTTTTNLEVMTRAGSATYNGLTAIAWTGITGLASNPVWSGGQSGCWGYLWNVSGNIWPSNVAIGQYGCWGASSDLAGGTSPGDVVHVRSGKTITAFTNVSVTTTLVDMGTVSEPVLFLVDDGTVWPADGVEPVLTFEKTNNGGQLWDWRSDANSFCHIKSKKYTSGQRNLELKVIFSGFLALNWSGPVVFEALAFTAPGTPTDAPGPVSTAFVYFKNRGGINGLAGKFTRFVDCVATWPGQQRTLIESTGGYTNKVQFTNLELVATAASSAFTSIITINNYSYNARVMIDGLKCIGFVPGSRLFASSVLTGNNTVLMRNPDLGGLTVLGPNFMASNSGEMLAGERGFFMSSQFGDREFVYERAGLIYAEWIEARGYPTLNALLPDGVTHWSIYAVPTTVEGNVCRSTPVDLPRISKVLPLAGDMAEAPRTFTLNFLVDASLSAWTRQDIIMQVHYVTPSGSIKVVDSYDPLAGALPVSTAAWSSTTWNGQTWLKRALSFTTPEPVMAGSEVSIFVCLTTNVSNDTQAVIVDPEILVS